MINQMIPSFVSIKNNLWDRIKSLLVVGLNSDVLTLTNPRIISGPCGIKGQFFFIKMFILKIVI